MTSFSSYCPIEEPFKISKANGIRFVYDTDGDFYYGQTIEDNTLYNEDPFCGSERESFSQPFPCDGIIRLQIVWCDSSTPLLGFYDVNDALITYVAGTNIQSNYYEWDLNLNDDPSFCEKCITLKIFKQIDTYGDELVINGAFTTDTDWGYNPAVYEITGGKAIHYTNADELFYQDIASLEPSKRYLVSFDITGFSGVGTSYFFLGANGSVAPGNPNNIEINGNGSYSIIVTTTSDMDSGLSGFSGSNLMTIDNVSVEDVIVVETIEAISEPLRISAYHKCLVKIEFWNDDAYDNIDYSLGYKNIMYVPITFGMAKFPEESKVYMKSNGTTLKLSGRIKKVTPIKTDYIPQYMHEKMAIIFSHDNVEIDGVSYVKEGEYAIDAIEKFTLAQGGTDLTKTIYNYINSNCD